MLRMEYTKDGIAISDFQIEETYAPMKEYVKHGSNFTMMFSTSLIFDRVRCGIAEDEIDAEAVTFVVRGGGHVVEFRPNRYGAIVDWPAGFLHSGYADRILRGAMAKKRREHGQASGS